MKHYLIIAVILALFLPLGVLGSPKSAYLWTQLANGLLYTSYSFDIGENTPRTIHAFNIDPAKYRLSIALAADEKEGSTVRQFAKQERALLAINGGFFTPEHTSIGLIVKDGKTLNPLHTTSWWSIFYITDGKPAISAPKDFAVKPFTSMALQAGPRLVIEGSIPKLKESISARSAIGITRDNKIIIAITQGLGISMNELAQRMKNSRYIGGLECQNAMALDGGSSSQLYAKIGKFELDFTGIARITNALIVKSAK